MSDRMREILSTLSDEALRAARTKCDELGLDPNRGVVSLHESSTNLAAARDLLIDAIDQGKLAQLPLSLQSALTVNLEAVARALTGLIGGADEVVNLTNATEELNAAMWQYGIHNLSGQVLGYHAKMNQLKHEEIALSNLRRELETGIAVKASLDARSSEAQTIVESLAAQLRAAEEQMNRMAESGTRAAEAEAKATALLATVQQTEGTSTQLLANTKTSSAEVLALEPRIKEFYGQIDEHRGRMLDTAAKADETVEKNRAQAEALIEQLFHLEGQIKEQIQRATGHSLFHSFQTRQHALARSKWFWAGALAIMVVCSVGLSSYVIRTTTAVNPTFFLKLSLGLPLIFAISFCAVQYGRERKLEEEYAFKSNISISLIPYQELVARLVTHTDPAEQAKYAAFIIESINKVFTSPTDRVFEGDGRHRGALTDKSIKQVLQTVEPLLKAVAMRER